MKTKAIEGNFIIYGNGSIYKRRAGKICTNEFNSSWLNLQGGPWLGLPIRFDAIMRVIRQCASFLCIFSPRGVWLYYTFSFVACQLE